MKIKSKSGWEVETDDYAGLTFKDPNENKNESRTLPLAREWAAQAWCSPENANKVLDVELTEEFAKIIDTIWSKPYLGNATTGELIEELKARSDLNYRTVDH